MWLVTDFQPLAHGFTSLHPAAGLHLVKSLEEGSFSQLQLIVQLLNLWIIALFAALYLEVFQEQRIRDMSTDIT